MLGENPGCPICGEPVTPKAGGGGRPKIYCTSRCAKKAVHRRSHGAPGSGPGRRRPLPEFAVSAGWSLRKGVERFERIFADDRFPAYKIQVAAQSRGHLEYAVKVCQDLLRQIDQPTGD